MAKDTDATATAEDAEFIFNEWHKRTYAGDGEGVLALYAPDAMFESPLVARLLDRPSGIVQGSEELRAFFYRAAENRPTDIVRGYRTGRFQFDGRTLHWEYPRITPNGDQVDLSEAIDLDGRRIVHHRVYWGWVGTPLLTQRPSDV